VVTVERPDLLRSSDDAAAADPGDPPLLAPVSRALSWEHIHLLSQRPLRDAGREPAVDVRLPGQAPGEPLITAIRRTAAVRRGTRMIRFFSGAHLGGYLAGRLPAGFCYRETDVAHLTSPNDLALLTGDGAGFDPGRSAAVFALRWRAVDPLDYHIPFSLPVAGMPAYPGLLGIPPHDRLGPPVLGTGFAPSSHHLIPEFITADLADLPMPANASLVAFTPDGQEVSLYTYLPEQRAWTRMFGPQWRHLLSAAPQIPLGQEYVQTTVENRTTLVGTFRGESFEAVADPPLGFRLLAKTRAVRYPAERLSRRNTYASWRGARGTIIRAESDWLRLRLCRPDMDSGPRLGAQCLERGVYEIWTPASEVTERVEAEVTYQLPPPVSTGPFLAAA
jgi:hypothetical protein